MIFVFLFSGNQRSNMLGRCLQPAANSGESTMGLGSRSSIKRTPYTDSLFGWYLQIFLIFAMRIMTTKCLISPKFRPLSFAVFLYSLFMLSSWIIHESPTQGRESGSLQYYSLPGVSLDGSVLHSSKPEHLAFNCTSTYVTSTHTLRALLHITLCSLSLSLVCVKLFIVLHIPKQWGVRCSLSLSLSLSLSRVCVKLFVVLHIQTNKQKRCEVLSLSLSLSHRKFSVVDNMGFLNLYELVCVAGRHLLEGGD